MSDSFMRWPEVRQATGLSRSTIWRLERVGAFPQRRRLSSHTVGWSEAEIQGWLKTRLTANDSKTV